MTKNLHIFFATYIAHALSMCTPQIITKRTPIFCSIRIEANEVSYIFRSVTWVWTGKYRKFLQKWGLSLYLLRSTDWGFLISCIAWMYMMCLKLFSRFSVYINSFCVLTILIKHLLWQFNFVGRILGPRGNSLKRVEATTGCRVLIRGRGSIKDTAKVR